LNNDDLGEADKDGNVVLVRKHVCGVTGAVIEKECVFTLPGDAYRDKVYMDWILADKTGEESLVGDYQDLMHKQFEQLSKKGSIGALDLLVAKSEANLLSDQDAILDAQLRLNDKEVDDNLKKLADRYGAEHLKNLSDNELYALYKKNSATSQ
jgi:hypothetical protein